LWREMEWGIGGDIFLLTPESIKGSGEHRKIRYWNPEPGRK